MPELPRLAGDLRSMASRPDGRHVVCAGSLDCERPRAHLLAGGASHGLRLPGEVGLVDGERIASTQGAVRDDLVARLDQHDVALDDLVHAYLAALAIPNDGRDRGYERREPVERQLGANFLRDSDPGVADEDREKQSVLHLPERECQDAGGEQDRVEDREDVRDDDALVGATRARRDRKSTRLNSSPEWI